MFPAIELDVVRRLQLADDVEDAVRVAVRRVDDEDVHLGVDERGRALERVGPDADRRAHSQPALLVLRRVRVLDPLRDVLDGDEALEPPVASTTGSFSILLRWRIASASSSVVPTGAVTRFRLVISAETGCEVSVSKRRSRFVRMPTSTPSSSVIGTPEIR